MLALTAALWCEAGPARALEMHDVKYACREELATFCKGVVPGRGRILACLYAFEEKVSDGCATAVLEGPGVLEQVFEYLASAVTACTEDLKKFCADVKPGGERMRACIRKNESAVSPRCKDALHRLP
jgi:hypothetical protein